eukprot:scaffold37999_cov17-Tisochrysis_lutea.AAC.1
MRNHIKEVKDVGSFHDVLRVGGSSIHKNRDLETCTIVEGSTIAILKIPNLKFGVVKKTLLKADWKTLKGEAHSHRSFACPTQNAHHIGCNFAASKASSEEHLNGNIRLKVFACACSSFFYWCSACGVRAGHTSIAVSQANATPLALPVPDGVGLFWGYSQEFPPPACMLGDLGSSQRFLYDTWVFEEENRPAAFTTNMPLYL